MQYADWNDLKRGDKIVFTNEKYPHQVGTVEEIYVDCNGDKYILGEKDSIFPLSEFDCRDFERVNEGGKNEQTMQSII